MTTDPAIDLTDILRLVASMVPWHKRTAQRLGGSFTTVLALDTAEEDGLDPVSLRRVGRLVAENLRGLDADEILACRAAIGPLVREVVRLRAALDQTRTALRLATDPKPDDLLGVRLVNGCAGLPDDTPSWVADLFREAWTAIRVLRADAEGKAARLDVMETERNEARDEVAAITAERDNAQDLVSRAIANAGRHAARPLWSHIMHLFAVGSTRAHALCAEHGYDPEQEVGPSTRPQRKA